MSTEKMSPVSVPGFEDVLVSELRCTNNLNNAFTQARKEGSKVQSSSEAVAIFIDEFNRRVKFNSPLGGRYWTGSGVIHTGDGLVVFDDEFLGELAVRGELDGSGRYLSDNHPVIKRAIERANRSNRLLPYSSDAGISVGNILSASNLLRDSPYFRAAVPDVADVFPEFVDDAHRRSRGLTFDDGFALCPSLHSCPAEGEVSILPLMLRAWDVGKKTDFSLGCVPFSHVNFPMGYRTVAERKPVQRTLF